MLGKMVDFQMLPYYFAVLKELLLSIKKGGTTYGMFRTSLTSNLGLFHYRCGECLWKLGKKTLIHDSGTLNKEICINSLKHFL